MPGAAIVAAIDQYNGVPSPIEWTGAANVATSVPVLSMIRPRSSSGPAVNSVAESSAMLTGRRTSPGVSDVFGKRWTTVNPSTTTPPPVADDPDVSGPDGPVVEPSSFDDPQAASTVPAPSAPTPSEMNDRRVRLTRSESTMGPMSKPLGPYTPVVQAGDWIIVSGQLGINDGALVEGGVAAQTAQAVENLKAQLATVGASLGDIAKTLCFLTDMDSFATFNDAYVAGFGDARPARSTIGVAALPFNGAVEIEAWAYRPTTSAK